MADFTDMYDYSTTPISLDETSAASDIAGFMGGLSIFSLVVLIVSIVSTWKIFEKAGKPGWAAIVPIYNIIVLLQIVNLSPWCILLYCIPFVNLIFSIVVTVRLAGVFGKSVGFSIGLIFLNVIFMPILAFSDAEYLEN